MSKVYIVQQHMRKDRSTGALVSHDYSSASQFGDIQFIVPVASQVLEDWNGDVDKMMNAKLEGFTKDDYLMPSGDTILCAQAVLIAASYLEEKSDMRMLKWDRNANSYKEVIVKLPM